METVTRLGRPRKGEESLRRSRLLEQAKELFAQYGYGNVSLENIAREAHVSLRTIYRLFGGKAELFGAVIRQVSDALATNLPLGTAPAQPLEDVLVEFGRQYLRQITQPECRRLRSQILAEAHQFPELAAEFYCNGPERTILRLTEFFSRYQELYRLADTDCRFLAEQFLHALRGEPFQRLQLGLAEPMSESEVEAWTRRVVHHFLHGCVKSERDS